MEKRDLYDINRNLTGKTIYKGLPIPKDKYILVVLCFIQNFKGDFLIQKRSRKKGGKYASTGGHPKASQTSIQGMVTEIKEELGLNVLPADLHLIFSDRDDFRQVFFDVYYLKKDFDIDDLILQKSEVESVEWLSLDQINELINDDLFLKSHAEDMYKMLDFLKGSEVNLE